MDLHDLLGGLDSGDLKDAVALVRDNKDILGKLDQLPALFRGLADSLDKAGGEARSAALALAGEDGHSGARKTLTDAAAALRSISGNVTKGASLIKDAGQLAGKVPLMDGPAGKLTETGDNLDATTGGLGGLAEALDGISGILGDVAMALQGVGDRLTDSSGAVRGFTG